MYDATEPPRDPDGGRDDRQRPRSGATPRSRRGFFIAVEGPTGAGKTTLVRRLPASLDAQPVFDPFEDNPFLAARYQASRGQAIESLAVLTELTFLALRVTQLREVGAALADGRSVVADWSMIKQLVFAGLTLARTDRDRLASTCAIWCSDLPVPDLVVQLRADVGTLRARITERGREMESGLSDAHLGLLSRAFDTAFARHGAPVLVVDAALFDVFDDEVVTRLAERIRFMVTSEEAECA